MPFAIRHFLQVPILFFMAMLLFAGTTPPANAFEEYTDTIGGNGGSHFEMRGRGPMLGLRLRIGDFTDAVEGFYVGKVGGRIESMGKAGGNGGRSVDIMCPRGQVLKGIQVTPVSPGGNRFVGEIKPGCVPASNPDARARLVATGWTGSSNQKPVWLTCGEGQIATGLIGRSGSYVDQVGLICNDTTSIFIEDVLKAIAVTAARKAAPADGGQSSKKPSRKLSGKEATCQAYAEDAMFKVKQNRLLKCGLGGSRYSDSFDGHYQWCMDTMDGAVEGEKRARAFEMSNCVDRACRSYAEDATAKAAYNRSARCGYKGGRYSTDYNAHFDWCRGVDPAIVVKERKARDLEIQDCQ